MTTSAKAPRQRTSPKTKLHQEVGARLRGLRQALALSQEELAHRIGMSVDAVSNIERGITFTTLDTLAKIAAVLNVTLAEIFTSETEGRPHLTPDLADIVARLSLQPEPVRALAKQQIEALLAFADRLKR